MHVCNDLDLGDALEQVLSPPLHTHDKEIKAFLKMRRVTTL
jgi:hypothetical protein